MHLKQVRILDCYWSSKAKNCNTLAITIELDVVSSYFQALIFVTNS